MIAIKIKPLSVNDCWRGQRFKTPEYKQYERDLLMLLPKMKVVKPTMITLNFGLSSVLADFDNPVKPFVDVLQKKYGFNDREIVEARIFKTKVEKGKEFIMFELK